MLTESPTPVAAAALAQSPSATPIPRDHHPVDSGRFNGGLPGAIPDLAARSQTRDTHACDLGLALGVWQTLTALDIQKGRAQGSRHCDQGTTDVPRGVPAVHSARR